MNLNFIIFFAVNRLYNFMFSHCHSILWSIFVNYFLSWFFNHLFSVFTWNYCEVVGFKLFKYLKIGSSRFFFDRDFFQGYSSGGPYDAIHVGAAAPTLPQHLGNLLIFETSTISWNQKEGGPPALGDKRQG